MWAFVERVGAALELPAGDVSTVVAWATWMGAVGAFIPILLGTRFGRFPLIVSAMIFSSSGTMMLYFADGMMPLIIGAVLVNMSWSYAIAYLLGLSAHYDETGQLAALGGTASKFGLATGPLIATTLIIDGDFGPVLIASSIGFIACLIVSTLPARHADKAAEGTES